MKFIILLIHDTKPLRENVLLNLFQHLPNNGKQLMKNALIY